MPICFTEGGELQWRWENSATSKGTTQKQTVFKTVFDLKYTIQAQADHSMCLWLIMVYLKQTESVRAMNMQYEYAHQESYMYQPSADW